MKSRDIINSFHRTALYPIHTGEAKNEKDALEFLSKLKFSIFVHPTEVLNPAIQVCLLTIVNVASRMNCEAQNVQVIGIKSKINLQMNYKGEQYLDEAIERLGGSCQTLFSSSDYPSILLGKASVPDNGFAVRAVFSNWSAGIVPASEANPFNVQNYVMPLAPIFAASVAISQCFSHINDEGSAIGKRSVGLSLWNLDAPDWLNELSGPKLEKLPSKIWFGGLGHLGQAYIWSLAQLPYQTNKDKCYSVLQDGSKIKKSTLSTSCLSELGDVGEYKNDICCSWLSDIGFQVTKYNEFLKAGDDICFGDFLFLSGFDNYDARRAAAGFSPNMLIDGGLGARANDCRSMHINSLPSDRHFNSIWPHSESNFQGKTPEAITNLEKEGLDQCGVIELKNTAVSMPFVGLTAATLVLSEALRALHGGRQYDFVSLNLEEVGERKSICKSEIHSFPKIPAVLVA